MDIGVFGHVLHNLILIVVYLLLGTIYLPGFVRRLDLPDKTRNIFRLSGFVFFLLCAYTHGELLLHIQGLPDDFFTWSHNVLGFLQAAGALGVIMVLHPLIYPLPQEE